MLTGDVRRPWIGWFAHVPAARACRVDVESICEASFFGESTEHPLCESGTADVAKADEEYRRASVGVCGVRVLDASGLGFVHNRRSGAEAGRKAYSEGTRKGNISKPNAVTPPRV